VDRVNAAVLREFGQPVTIVRSDGTRTDVTAIVDDPPDLVRIGEIEVLGVRRSVTLPAADVPDEAGLRCEIDGTAYDVKPGGRIPTGDGGKTVLLLLQDVAT
jgi:hypothetical protein